MDEPLEAFLFWREVLRRITLLRGGGTLPWQDKTPEFFSGLPPEVQVMILRQMQNSTRQHLTGIKNSLARGYRPPLWWKQAYSELIAALEEVQDENGVAHEARRRASLELRSRGFPEAAKLCEEPLVSSHLRKPFGADILHL